MLAHVGCYLRESATDVAEVDPTPERIGVMDLECSGLQSDYSQVLTWVILDSATGKVYKDQITRADIKSGTEDRRILQSLVSCVKEFDRIVTFYGSRYDIPYARSRCMIQGVDFPEHGSIRHTDLWFHMRSKFGTLSSKRLENCTRQLLHKTLKTRIESRHWKRALQLADPKALAFIIDHNVKDCIDTNKLFLATRRFFKLTNTSI
jgi:uncharacterized protein YprB with RNaseH-like and TPR domain